MRRRRLLFAGISIGLGFLPGELAAFRATQSDLEAEGSEDFIFLTIDGSAMFPTLHDGDTCLVNLNAYSGATMNRGEIIIFEPPVQSSKPYVKRIIGLPNETVEIRDGSVFIDSEKLDEPYETAGTTDCSRECGPWDVLEDQIFVLGDNRHNSSDSRVFGPIMTESVQGRAEFVVRTQSEEADGTGQIESLLLPNATLTPVAFVVVTNEAMLPSIAKDSVVLFDTRAYSSKPPYRGDIVSFDHSFSEFPLVRRVIGLQNETIEFKAGKVIIDGLVLEEPYIQGYFTDCVEGDCKLTAVPEGNVFVLSDNRSFGEDSRTLGPVEFSSLQGKAIGVAQDQPSGFVQRVATS